MPELLVRIFTHFFSPMTIMDSPIDHPDEQTFTITDVRQGRNRRQPRLVYVDGSFAFRMSEDICMKSGIYRGMRATAEQLAAVRFQEEVYQAKQTALRIATRRLRSIREVERKLKEKEFSPEAIDAAIAFLHEYGMANDALFAKAFVAEQLLKRPLGKRRLELELRKRGVSRELIEATLTHADNGDEEYARAMTAAEKKAASIRRKEGPAWDRSMSNFLAGRGFGWDVIAKVVRKMAGERKARGDGEGTTSDEATGGEEPWD